MIYAIIEQSLVTNVVEWDGVSDWQPPNGAEVQPLTDGAGIGWSYVDGEFVPPPAPEPPVIEE